MDPALFKSTTTSRGLTYAYYASPARSGQPTLLFLHGFGSTAARERARIGHDNVRSMGDNHSSVAHSEIFPDEKCPTWAFIQCAASQP